MASPAKYVVYGTVKKDGVTQSGLDVKIENTTKGDIEISFKNTKAGCEYILQKEGTQYTGQIRRLGNQQRAFKSRFNLTREQACDLEMEIIDRYLAWRNANQKPPNR